VLDLLAITERQLDIMVPGIVKRVVEKWGKDIFDYENQDPEQIRKLAKYIKRSVVPKLVISDDLSERNRDRITLFILAKLYKYVWGKEWEIGERTEKEEAAVLLQ